MLGGALWATHAGSFPLVDVFLQDSAEGFIEGIQVRFLVFDDLLGGKLHWNAVPQS